MFFFGKVGINTSMQPPKNAMIYWIHLPEHTDFSTQGYVGVSKNISNAYADHYSKLKNNMHKNPHLLHAANKYGWDNLVKDIILIGSESYCYYISSILRDRPGIGWNISIGGRRGPGWPSGKKHSQESLLLMKERHALLEPLRTSIREEKHQEKIRLKEEKTEKRKQANIEKHQENLRLKEEKTEKRKQANIEKHQEKLRLKEENIRHKIEKIKLTQLSRPLCTVCRNTPASINYRTTDGIIHYRSCCTSCIRANKNLKPQKPAWLLAGYKKKPHCEQCGFKAKYKDQLFVYHIDGILSHTHWSNLKTICANCQIEILKTGLGWAQGELTPDF